MGPGVDSGRQALQLIGLDSLDELPWYPRLLRDLGDGETFLTPPFHQELPDRPPIIVQTYDASRPRRPGRGARGFGPA
jgi:hypothetical protein